MTVETEKKRKYDVLANKPRSKMKCKTKIIPYVMTWDGVVTNYHKQYLREIGLINSVEAYIQTTSGYIENAQLTNLFKLIASSTIQLFTTCT
ncbi:hypothetical protein PAEPH01_1074 [Pancytospora epiphaga]|nr:hypothetical protein PAEPH01_1074 [Pancytospora epiphaga]